MKIFSISPLAASSNSSLTATAIAVDNRPLQTFLLTFNQTSKVLFNIEPDRQGKDRSEEKKITGLLLFPFESSSHFLFLTSHLGLINTRK